MKYEDLSTDQKRDYGFIKLSKREIRSLQQMETDRKKKSASRTMGIHRPQLRLIVNEG